MDFGRYSNINDNLTRNKLTLIKTVEYSIDESVQYRHNEKKFAYLLIEKNISNFAGLGITKIFFNPKWSNTYDAPVWAGMVPCFYYYADLTDVPEESKTFLILNNTIIIDNAEM